MSFYRRNLPHWQPAGADYFVTFRLAGSLPKEVIADLKREKEPLYMKFKHESTSSAQRAELRVNTQKKLFKKYESFLDKGDVGPTWLKRPKIAGIVRDSIHHRDKKDYELYAYCIMSNHVHIVFKHISEIISQEQSENFFPVTEILESLKKFTARKCNSILNRTGNSFWQAESYDHVIRDSDELENVIRYTLYNPVKSGLVKDWKDWAFTYCKPEFVEQF